MKETFSIFGGNLELLRQDFRPSEDGLWLASVVSGVYPKAISEGSVLDSFSGTGIIGLAALHFGAKKVTAVDIDADLIEQSMANAYLNNWAEKWTPICADISDLETLQGHTYDVVLANPPFHALAAGFSATAALKKSAHGLAEGDLARWLPALWGRVADSAGILAMILHVREAEVVQTFLQEHQLSAQWVFLESSPTKPAKRVIVMIGRKVASREGILRTWDDDVRERVLRKGEVILAGDIQPL